MKQNIVLMFTLIALLAGCSSMPLSKQQVNKVQSIAIINNFPQYPSYSSIGTTVFQNSYDKIINKNYQEELSSIFAKYLGQKGYKNVAVYNKTKKYKGEVDLVITLEPSGLNRPAAPNNAGYGIYQRSFFGIQDKASTYIEMNALIKLKSGEEFNTHFHDFSPVSFKDLPKKWDYLSNSQKNEIESKIKQNMKKSINAMRDLGL
ncbi:hypothetical protein [uncultured Gammaproteobacteria bacterium]|jgi:hypothetical protein|nr:hypothetical protein [uncultured Gammaproteobacteria bacterium]